MWVTGNMDPCPYYPTCKVHIPRTVGNMDTSEELLFSLPKEKFMGGGVFLMVDDIDNMQVLLHASFEISNPDTFDDIAYFP